MLPETSTEPINPVLESMDWQPPMPPTDLIFDDGEPLETNRHRVAMNVLIRSLQQHWADRTDFYAGGNMFIYYSSTQVRNQTAVATTGGDWGPLWGWGETPLRVTLEDSLPLRYRHFAYAGEPVHRKWLTATHCLDFRGPDFFVVLDVDGTRERQGWVIWEEDGRYPDVIVEFMSPSTAKVDLNAKKHLYDRVFKTQDYFVYNPFDPCSFQGWHRNSAYRPIVSDGRGWLWCETLSLWLGTWEGTIDRETAVWLRFYNPEGNLVLLPEEAAQQRAESEQQRAESERQRAERLAARLRELGEDPERL